MRSDIITAQHLARVAYVYVRQSTQYQAEHNLESQARQYQLVDRAKELGFTEVRVIDEDLGVSGAVGSERSGFKRLVAEVSLGRVGMVLGLEISRFARNNAQLYHLFDLCALFDTLIADQDGIYHPGAANDRMVLGLKGTMSEVELSLIKQRMLEGARNKAKRGELIYRLPVGLVKTEDQTIEKDPDERVRKSIEQVFVKFRETQSARQTFLWFIQENISFPSIRYGKYGKETVWICPVYGTIYDVLKNPFYAGIYAYGRRKSRARLEDGQIKKTRGHAIAMDDWQVLIKDNHEAYISWDEYVKNQGIMKENNVRTSVGGRGKPLKGNGLLAGLLRCRRCGRKLVVTYGGKNSKIPAYSCSQARLRKGDRGCISFGGMRVDEAVCREVLKVVEPLGIEAAFRAIEELNEGLAQERQLIELELQNAEYESERAYRQYNKADPENRLVCAQLERKWNSCLERAEEVRKKLSAKQTPVATLGEVEKRELLALSSELPFLWNSPSTTNEMRKQIVRSVIREIVCDVDMDNFLINFTIHWEGGVHTQLCVKKNRTGEHRNSTDKATVEIVGELTKILPDKAIAPILNRLKIKTGAGNAWNRDRVRSLRNQYGIAAFDRSQEKSFVSLQEAAERLGICPQSVRGLISQQIIKAHQAVACAPWIIPREELERDEVKSAAKKVKRGGNRAPRCEAQLTIFQ
jgi:DNA invertase Pin-like site-specific DNA recombinase